MKAISKFGTLFLVISLLVPHAFADELIAPEAPAPEPVIESVATTTPEVLEPELAQEVRVEPVVTDAGAQYVPGEVIVKFKESSIDLERASGEAKAEAFAENQGLEVSDSIAPANVVVLETEANPAVEAARLEADPNVEYAEPNYLYRIEAIATNDTHRALLWALENTGQSVNGTTGTNDTDIDAPEAWTMSTGDEVIVAVIDTGVDYDHPDLENSMWDGSSCTLNGTPVSGGCIHGYDFPRDDNNPMPQYNHGTHIAGTIAAEKNNGVGSIGVAPDARIMALRTDVSSTSLSTTAIVDAIGFAAENGAQVINASFGGPGFSQAIYDAIEDFGASGGIFVAAAGNEGIDIETDPFYPASYDLEAVISVTATNQSDALASFSNYSDSLVDVGAPGVNILSTLPGGGYGYKSGTSMAAPHVSGLAAQLLALNPTLTVADAKEAILSGGDPGEALAGITTSGKRINAFGSLASVAAGFATSTLNVTISIVNDNGRTATTTDIEFTVDGTTHTFATSSATTTLALTPGFYTVTGVAISGYAVSSSNCMNVLLLPSATTTCALVYDDAVDVTPPIITLMGANPQSFTVGGAYTELGATAADETDGDLTSSISIDSSSVSTSAAGTYDVLYSVSDVAGNSASTTRSVLVTAPISSGGGGGGGGGGSSSSRSRKQEAPKKAAATTTPALVNVPQVPPVEVAGAYSYTFTLDLTLGSQGVEVTELQKFLIAGGYLSGAATGYFGSLTKNALVNYQLAKGISPASGYFGVLTRSSINGGAVLGASTDTTALQAKIVELQKLLGLLMAQLAAMGD